MGSRVFLTNLVSDVPGYLLALVDMRNPNLPSTPVVSQTTATAGGSNIQMTATAGGTPLSWITRKLSVPVTLGAIVGESVFVNMSARATAGGSGPQIRLARYTGGVEQPPFLTDSAFAALLSAQQPNMWATAASPNWTSIGPLAVGDRLVIKGYVNNVGTMTAGTVFMNYDGLAGAAGDTYIELLEILQVSQAQIGSSFTAAVRADGVSYFLQHAQNIVDSDPQMNGVITQGAGSGGWTSDDSTQLAVYNESVNQSKLV